MTDSITFISIIDPVKFLKIQNQFISNDIYLNNPENYFTKCNKTDFGLNVSKLYSSKDKKPEPDFFFFKHYLNNEIQSLAENFIDAYTKELNKLELNNGNINLYYSQTIETLLKYEKIIEITNHLIEEIKKRVQEKIAVCIDRIQEINTAKKIHLGNKISFKLIRQDVLVLFYLLREKEIIKWHTNNELKVLIENNLCLTILSQKNTSF